MSRSRSIIRERETERGEGCNMSNRERGKGRVNMSPNKPHRERETRLTCQVNDPTHIHKGLT